MNWTEQMTGELRKWCAAGLSYSEIGARIGVSRNAAIGKAARLGLDNGNKPSRQTEASAQRIRAASIQRHAIRRAAKETTIALRIEAPSLDPLSDASGQPITAINVTRLQCRYGYGDPLEPTFRFCGRTTEPESSWCAAHAAICIDTVTTARSAARAKASDTEQRNAA